MNIEEELFKNYKIDFNKLSKYGFIKENNLYKYYKNIMNDTFKIYIEINNEGIIKGKIYDLYSKEEYTNFRIKNNTGSFVEQVRYEFKNVLEDIRNNCFYINPFKYEQTNRILNLIKQKYDDEPQFEWEKFPSFATFKNKYSKKWYAIIMNIDKNKLEKKGIGEIEIIDIKLNPIEVQELLKQKGFYPAYHMNKKNWITIISDDTLSDNKIMDLIDKSYSYSTNTNEWIVPANPKYFDIEKALKKNNTIMWKQNTSIKINDIVYLYVGYPYSSIMYKFKVKEVNIPYEYKDKNLKIKKIMYMDLIKRFEKGQIPFNELKKFGVNAIRGQRYMPKELSEYIDKIN